jgi:hypothetical protein
MNIKEEYPDVGLFRLRIALPAAQLGGLRRRWLLREIIVTDDIDETSPSLDGGDCMLAWLYDFLGGLPWVAPEAAQLIIKESQAQMREIGHMLGLWQRGILPSALNDPTLAFADKKFVTWTGWQGWTSLDSGRGHSKLPMTPLESIAYNLAELFKRNYHQAKARRDAHSAGKPTDVPRGTALGLD